MTEPNQAVVPPFEYISLAGKLWPIPLLGPRQNRIVIPKLMELFKKIFSQLPDGYQIGQPITPEVVAGITVSTAQYDDMIEVVWLALTKAHPKLGKDEFLDWPIPTAELTGSLFIILKQTGHIKVGKSDDPSGEARAESP